VRFRWHEQQSAEQIAAIAAQIDNAGFCRIDDFLAPDELNGLAAFAITASNEAGGEFVDFVNRGNFDGTIWPDLATSPALKHLSEALYRHSTKRSGGGEEFYRVFRCLKGKSAARHSHYFHFDSYAVTVLIPVVIPEDGSSGDFVLYPSIRPVRRTYLHNVIDKAFRDLPPVQTLYRKRFNSGRAKAVRVPLEPGTAVILWGYRSLHTNEPSDPDKLRATALLHYGNPHGRSYARR